MNESSSLQLLATTAFGIEAVTARELQQLGYQTEIVGSGRVRFRGTLTDAMRANLWLRTADRVLIEVAQIPKAVVANNWSELDSFTRLL